MNTILRGACSVSLLLVLAGQARGACADLVTNFASATFSLASGAPGDLVEPGTNALNVPNSASGWVLYTTEPQLCLELWKVADDGSWTLQPTASPGEKVCFTVSYRNCGNVTGRSVTITDLMPANTTRSDLPVKFTPGLVPSSTWATGLAGPWLTTSPAGQGATSSVYLRWIIASLGLGQSGYINYCVTVQ